MTTTSTGGPGLGRLGTLRLTAAGLCLIAVCYGLARFAYGMFLPAFRAEFGLDPQTAGAIASGSYIAYCVAIVVSTILTPRLGARVVAVSAGVVAAVGTAVVAVAPNALVLAAGVLLAGSSTGIASPPLAHAVALFVRGGVRDRTQTVINAGTGAGVALAGPVALLTVGQWRLAWWAFAVIARSSPSGSLARFRAGTRQGRSRTVGRPSCPDRRASGRRPTHRRRRTHGNRELSGVDVRPRPPRRGRGDRSDRLGDRLDPARGVRTRRGDHWRCCAAAGPAPGVDAVDARPRRRHHRLRPRPRRPRHSMDVSGAVFGAVYIVLTGLVLIWGTEICADAPAAGVGLGFLVLALGQAIGSPLVGALLAEAGPIPAFSVAAACAALGALIRPRPH